MLNPFKWLENLLYLVRDALWNYPDTLFWGRDSAYAALGRIYALTRPYSHFVLATVGVILVILLISPGSVVTANTNETLIEGVVIGTDQNGDILQLSKVNPLLPTSIQLEKDITELVYEPLIRFEQDGSITPILAGSILRIQEGAEYEFEIQKGVFWHDGQPFRVEDIERTLQIISELDDNNERYKDSSYVRAIKQMAWERTGEDTIRICTTSTDLLATLSEADVQRRCSGVSGEKPILSNFLELISIRIMPAHRTGDINTLTIDKPDPEINRFPVGTGPYRFFGTGDNSISLVRNDDYHGAKPHIRTIQFKLFKDADAVVEALQNGEIHSFATSSTEHLRELSLYPQVLAYKSPVLRNQYWALYFNLRTDLEGKALGPSFFSDINVRQAISSAVNRDRIIQTLLDVGVEAKGPIYEDSEYYNENVSWFRYDPVKAATLLDEAGWVVDPGTRIRHKDGQALSFQMSYVDSYDRAKIAVSIQQDLKAVGIDLQLDARDLQEMTDQVVAPKLFDSLLYGMRTFIDPDRYELFHSGETLNIASYAGTEKTVKIENRQRIELPRVDRLLEQARSFDPLEAKDQRKENYDKVQELIALDSPVVFLYHPQFIYYASNRVESIDLSRVAGLEQRFRNIAKWGVN